MKSLLSILTASERRRLNKTPTQRFARRIAEAAMQNNRHGSKEFRRAFGFLGTWSNWKRRDTDELRLRLEAVGEMPPNLWKQLSRISQQDGNPAGAFTAYALGIKDVPPQVFGQLVEALQANSPDESVSLLLRRFHGKLPHMALPSFSQTAYLLRPDLYGPFNKQSFVPPLKQFMSIDSYERFPAVCRSLRRLCDSQRFPKKARFCYLDDCISRQWESAEPILTAHLATEVVHERTSMAAPDLDNAATDAIDEGRTKRLQFHLVNERKHRDAYIRLIAASLQGFPELCDICEMDPAAVYGDDFAPALQIHHKDPLASGSRSTIASDLAVLCANCHLACHVCLAKQRPEKHSHRSSRQACARNSYTVFRNHMRKRIDSQS